MTGDHRPARRPYRAAGARGAGGTACSAGARDPVGISPSPPLKAILSADVLMIAILPMALCVFSAVSAEEKIHCGIRTDSGVQTS